jgi:hypothetical protein
VSYATRQEKSFVICGTLGFKNVIILVCRKEKGMIENIESVILDACCPVYSWSAYPNKDTFKIISEKTNLPIEFITSLMKPEIREMASGLGIDRDSLRKIALSIKVKLANLPKGTDES